MSEIIEALFDRVLISDLRFISNNKGLVAWSKRSKYRVTLPKQINKKIAYLSGVIMGDGNVSITKRKVSKYPRLRLMIFNTSKGYLQFLNDQFYNLFRIKGKISKKQDKNCYMLKLHNKLVILYFLKIIEIPCGKKMGLKVPKLLKNRILFKHFIAGLFDTDGYFSGTFGIMMSGTNYEFLKEIITLLERYYSIYSRKLWFGTLNTSTGLKTRSQVQIRSKDISKFINTIPLKHTRYGPVV